MQVCNETEEGIDKSLKILQVNLAIRILRFLNDILRRRFFCFIDFDIDGRSINKILGVIEESQNYETGLVILFGYIIIKHLERFLKTTII